jgi:hypothetical protein
VIHGTNRDADNYFRNQVIRADDVARALVDVVDRVAQGPRSLVFENRDIRAMRQ